jgi:hypothetical protein
VGLSRIPCANITSASQCGDGLGLTPLAASLVLPSACDSVDAPQQLSLPHFARLARRLAPPSSFRAWLQCSTEPAFAALALHRLLRCATVSRYPSQPASLLACLSVCLLQSSPKPSSHPGTQTDPTYLHCYIHYLLEMTEKCLPEPHPFFSVPSRHV